MKVKLHFEPQHVTLDVTDDGAGFDVEDGASGSDGAGRGITNMRERSAEFGGTIEVQSAPHQGTTIHVVLPTDAVPSGGPR